METTVFLNIITIAGIGYMLIRNYKLFNTMKWKISIDNLKNFWNIKNKLHFQEHLIISIFIFSAGFLWIFGLLTWNDTNFMWVLTSSMILDTIINTLPYIILGFVADHLVKEEIGEYKYNNCDYCVNNGVDKRVENINNCNM